MLEVMDLWTPAKGSAARLIGLARGFVMPELASRSFAALLLLSLLLPTLAYQIPAAYRVNLGAEDDGLYLSGFYYPEWTGDSWFRWSKGRAAITLLGPGGNRALRLKMRLGALRPVSPPQVSLWINHNEVARFAPGGQMAVYEFPIERTQAGWYWDKSIELRSETFVPGPDPRELGVQLAWLLLEPVPGDLAPSLPSLPLVGGIALTSLAAFLLLRAQRFSRPTALMGSALLPVVSGWALAFRRQDLASHAPMFLAALAVTIALGASLLRAAGEQLRHRKANALGLALLLAMVATASVLVWQKELLLNGTFGWDEAEHSYWGHKIAQDLRLLDLRALWVDSNSRILYPPAFSWLQSLVLLALGESFASARLVSLLSLALATVVLYFLCLELSPDRGWLVGLLAATMIWTARGMLVLAGLAMIEHVVLLTITLTLYAYARALRAPSWAWYMAVGLACVLTFMTKYNYGLLVIATIAVTELFEHGWGFRGLDGAWALFIKRRTLFCIFVPFVAIAALYLLTPPPTKLAGFQYFLTNRPVENNLLSASNLLFYPQIWLSQFSGSTALFGLALAGLALALRHWRNSQLRTPIVFFAIGFVASVYHPIKGDRYIAPLLPAFWIAASYALIEVLYTLTARLRATGHGSALFRGTSLLLLALYLAPAGGLYWNRLGPTQSAGAMGSTIAETLSTIRAVHDPTKPMAVLGTFAEFSYGLINWDFGTDKSFYRAVPLLRWPELELPVRGVDYDTALAKWLDRKDVYSMVAVGVGERSPFFSGDYLEFNAWKLIYVMAMERMPRWNKVAERYFPETDVSLRIYQPAVPK
jgi:hypothetical protein